jgi:hypothetical protein
MFAKVARRVRRRSPGLPQEIVIVDVAPELLRWADFSTPFPSVSMGGYNRYYETHTTSEPKEPLRFCPLLSQQPEPSPSSKIPPKSPLFDSLRRKGLPVIREVSLESIALNFKPRNLTITTSTTTPPRSLKRRQRQLLRTPSVERDFPLDRCQSPSDTTSITINNDRADATPTDTPPSPTSSIFSSDSRLSHKRSDSNDSEFPITPTTSIDSIDSEDEILSTEFLDKLSSIPSPPQIEFEFESESGSAMKSPISPMSPSSCCTVKIHPAESVVTRPLSTISSYSTARSDFSEI